MTKRSDIEKRFQEAIDNNVNAEYILTRQGGQSFVRNTETAAKACFEIHKKEAIEFARFVAFHVVPRRNGKQISFKSMSDSEIYNLFLTNKEEK